MSQSHDNVPEKPAKEPGSTRSVNLAANSDSFMVVPGLADDEHEAIDQQKTVITRRPKEQPAPRLAPIVSARTLEGSRLDHFELEEGVGGGGMGAVYRAQDTLLGRHVAVKVIAGDQQDEETLKRFRNEAQNAARLDHPNIARVYHVGHDKGWHYIVFEFISGVNIRELVEHKGPLPFDEAFSYTLQVAEALDHAFRRGVIHRDIKPSNIIVMPDGNVKLVDMGLARFSDMDSSSNDLTASGVTLGTFDYISPEQARDPRDADVRSDIYSLGCTLFYMLTGQPPFTNGTVLQKLISHSSDPPPDIREFREDADAELAAIINHCLEKKPADRQQEPSQLVGELLVLAKHWQLPLKGVGDNVTITQRPAPVNWFVNQAYWIVPVVLLLAGVVAVRGTAESELQLPPLDLPPLAVASHSNNAPEAGSTGVEDADPATPVTDVEPVSGEDAPRPSTAGSTPTTSQVADAATTETLDNGTVTDSDVDDAMTSSADTADTTTAPTPAEPTKISRVVVTDTSIALDPNEQAVETVEEAIRMAAQDPDISEVVLAFTGKRDVGLVEVRLNPAGGHVVVTAGDGHRPELHFDTTAKKLKAQLKLQNPTMIGVMGGTMTWQGIGFSFQLPDSPFERTSWTLFRIDHVMSVDFSECYFTVRNADEYGLVNSDVSVFDFAGNMSSKLMLDRVNGDRFNNHVNFTNCVVRGEACLLRCNEGAPFGFEWNNGFLITSEQLLSAEGSGAMLLNDRHEMSVTLNRVTAVVDKPLCEVNWQNATKPLKLVVKLDDSLIRCNPTDKVLIMTDGYRSLGGAENLMEFATTESYLPHSKICWRAITDDFDVPSDFRFSDSYTQERPWFSQLDPVSTVTMSDVELDDSAMKHAQTPEQYRVDASSPSKPGFRFELLPTTPSTGELIDPAIDLSGPSDE